MVVNSAARQAATHTQLFHKLWSKRLCSKLSGIGSEKSCQLNCPYQRRISHAPCAVTSSGTPSCWRAATASVGSVWSAAGTPPPFDVARCAADGRPDAALPPTWLWGTCARPSCRAGPGGRPSGPGSSALSMGRSLSCSARTTSCPFVWCARRPKHTRATSVCH